MKIVDAALTIIKVALKADGHATERQLFPRQFLGFEQGYLQALLACRVISRGQSSAVEKMNLVDVREADHGEWRIDEDLRASLLKGFPASGIGCRLAVLHEAGR